ncbi:hypothetical protein [Yinghuangia seranimata]|uniref:hypothetical protein n=1 Tax=Yinghuangia seranimata TaxID=408067 RepID=UPI00248B6B90|nr:hypothetical protein [Yinghuangia seranimata]MDI2128881.1 hypothetical protein [Yinghuangia seranimata]
MIGDRAWRPVERRPGEGWEVLPRLKWVLVGGLAALLLLGLCVATALSDSC